jgi:integration host factor subunit alpha
MVLTKAVIITSLAKGIGINKREAREISEAFFATIVNELIAGNIVKLSGFGNFKLHNKKERPGRNLRTGAIVAISARRVVTFKSGKKLRSLLDKHCALKTKD